LSGAARADIKSGKSETLSTPIIKRLDLHDLADLDAKNIDEREQTETSVGLPLRGHVITIRAMWRTVRTSLMTADKR
jgi:hypothetical protein